MYPIDPELFRVVDDLRRQIDDLIPPMPIHDLMRSIEEAQSTLSAMDAIRQAANSVDISGIASSLALCVDKMQRPQIDLRSIPWPDLGIDYKALAANIEHALSFIPEEDEHHQPAQELVHDLETTSRPVLSIERIISIISLILSLIAIFQSGKIIRQQETIIDQNNIIISQNAENARQNRETDDLDRVATNPQKECLEELSTDQQELWDTITFLCEKLEELTDAIEDEEDEHVPNDSMQD